MLLTAETPLGSRAERHQPTLPEHLIGLPGGTWAVWRWAALRSAGFPADDVLSLAFPECAAAADELLRLEAAFQTLRVDIEAQVREAFDTARARDNSALAQALSRVRRQLKSERLPDPLGCPEIDAALRGLHGARAEIAVARRHFDRLFSAARDESSRAVRKTAATSRFREAVIWQNHPVLRTCIEPLLRSDAGARSSKHRQHEELIASYLHRYCVKNETIGFFGPVGWARFADRGQALDVEPGAQLLRSREVYFEQWAIDLLAERLSAADALKPWIVARRTPVAYSTGLTVRRPFQPPVTLTKEELAVLSACDGVRTTCQLADRLCHEGSGPRLTRDRIAAILDKLRDERLISLSFDLPFDAHPERRLREQLEQISDEELRRSAMAPVTKLEAARAAVAAAAGDPDRLHRALLDLDSRFTALTGAKPSRSAGQMYWGRTLVFEDCQRDVAIQIGPPILASLGPPLTLILLSARWLTYQVGQHCRAAFLALFDRMVQARGADTVGFVEFYNYALNLLSKETAFSGFAAELQKRWAKILSPPESAKLVRYTSHDLQSRIAEAFDAPAPGWPGACYHSPDLMIAGSSREAINAGDCHFVLGELHLGANTLRGQFFIEQHPHPDDIFRGIDADLPGIRLAPITPKRYSRRAARNFPVLASGNHYFAALTLDSVPPPGSITLAGNTLEIRKADGDLVIASRDGALQFDLLQSFSGLLARIVVDNFAIMLPTAHTPRILIDNFIVVRETWRFERSEIDFAESATSAARFLTARRWRDRHGMPRWVFVRIPGEGKPVYLDFDSPFAVDIVARRVRNQAPSPAGAKSISVSEMVPSHGQHWLPDAEGRRYSCELRIVAVDQARDRTAPKAMSSAAHRHSERRAPTHDAQFAADASRRGEVRDARG